MQILFPRHEAVLVFNATRSQLTKSFSTLLPPTTISSSSSSSSIHHFSGRSCTTRSNTELRRSTNITKTNKMRNKIANKKSIKAAAAEPPVLPYRVGHGFDLHRLESTAEFPELKLILGGIEVPHDRGCVAHSDGDVLLHCVVDAITGALGLPDIGQLFPDNDPKWKGQTSDVFIYEAIRSMRRLRKTWRSCWTCTNPW